MIAAGGDETRRIGRESDGGNIADMRSERFRPPKSFGRNRPEIYGLASRRGQPVTVGREREP